METNTSSLNLEGGTGVLENLRPQRPSGMWVILGYMAITENVTYGSIVGQKVINYLYVAHFYSFLLIQKLLVLFRTVECIFSTQNVWGLLIPDISKKTFKHDLNTMI